MKTVSPTVSNTHMAASGIRPNVGRTARSQPNTRPMIRAPPLAVRVSGSPPIVTESRPTSPPMKIPRPTKIMSVATVGRSAYPTFFAARSTSRLAPTRLTTSPRSMRVSGVNGMGCPSRTSFLRNTPRAISRAASSLSVFPASALFVTTTSRNSCGKSRSTLSSTSGPISVPRAVRVSVRVITATTSSL